VAWWNRGASSRRRAPASLTRHRAGETAAAVRYDLGNEDDRKKLARAQQKWTEDAWYYVDAVGEAKDCERFVGNSFRRLRFYAAWQREPDEPAIAVADAVRTNDAAADLPSGQEVADVDEEDYLDETWARRAEEIVAGFAARDGGQGVLLERLGVNLFVAGEALLVNREVAERRPTAAERPEQVPKVMDWEVRAVGEIRKAQTGDGMIIVDTPDQRDGIPLEPDAYVERVWRKHARWSGWSDSNFRAAVGVLEELDLLARLARASIRSRLLAGMVTLPDELDFGDADQPAGEGNGGSRVTFDREIADAMTAVIGDEADPNTVAPLVLRGPKDLLGPDAVRVIEFPRRYGEEERAEYEEAVKRLGRTLDLPVERIVGMADLNHWTAWQVDDTTYEAYIEPLVDVAREALTYGLLRPLLTEEGCPPEVVARLLVNADPSALVRQPDRGKTATEGHKLFTLSDEAWRQANGFSTADAPSDDELRRRLAMARSTLSAEVFTVLLEEVGLLPAGTAEKVAAMKPSGGQSAPAGDGEADTTDEAGIPDGEGEQAEAHAAVAAAASRMVAAHSLSLADRVLRERVTTAADAAVTRAVERAGARLRTKASRHTDTRAALRAAGDVPNVDVGRVLGPASVAALANDEDLFGDAFEDLHGRFDSWTADVQADALDTLGQVATIGDAERTTIEREQREDREGAWEWLLGALLALAAAKLRGGDVVDDGGEFDPTIVVPPGLIREALAMAGGERVERAAQGGLLTASGQPAGGVATGQVIRLAFAEAGFPWSGYVWNYGLAPRQQPFEPHRALAGAEFATWDDPVLVNAAGVWPYVAHFHPGDHWYCRCDFAPVIAEASAASA
jgi:hypothetical protein